MKLRTSWASVPSSAPRSSPTFGACPPRHTRLLGISSGRVARTPKRDDAVRPRAQPRLKWDFRPAVLLPLAEVPPRIDSRYVVTTTREVPRSNEPGPFGVANFRRRVCTRDRVIGRREAGEDLRSPLDVHFERARKRRDRPRNGTHREHEREDDRSPLRSTRRHGTRVTARAA